MATDAPSLPTPLTADSRLHVDVSIRPVRRDRSPATTRASESPSVKAEARIEDTFALVSWLGNDACIPAAEVPEVISALAHEGIPTLVALRKHGLPRGGTVLAENDPALRPFQRLRIVQQLANEAAERASAAFAASAWATASVAFFATLLVLSGLLAYRKLSDALDECCGAPRLGLLQRIAGWLWAAEYASPTIALGLMLWWIALLPGLWQTVRP
jgi:hypothetical protein